MGGQKVLLDKDVYNMPTHNNLCYGIEEMQYHNSWDWLMPVIEKCVRTGDDTDRWDNIFNTLTTLSIKEVYEEVVEFIKEYNNEAQ